MDADEVFPVGRSGKVEERVASDDVVAALENFSGEVRHDEAGVGAGIETLGLGVHEDALSFCQADFPTVDLVGIGETVGMGVERQGGSGRGGMMGGTGVGDDEGRLGHDVKETRSGPAEIAVDAGLGRTFGYGLGHGDAECFCSGDEFRFDRWIGKSKDGEVLDIQSGDGDLRHLAGPEDWRGERVQLSRRQLGMDGQRQGEKGNKNADAEMIHPHKTIGKIGRGDGSVVEEKLLRVHERPEDVLEGLLLGFGAGGFVSGGGGAALSHEMRLCGVELGLARLAGEGVEVELAEALGVGPVGGFGERGGTSFGMTELVLDRLGIDEVQTLG